MREPEQSVLGFAASLERGRGYQDQIAGRTVIPARQARYADLERPLSPAIQAVLDALGIGRLYVHQAAAIDRVRSGANVAVVTSTASGKTLCYNIPVMERLLESRGSRALYIFPTKALAQDQLRRLRELDIAEELTFDTYDGDTKPERRRDVRRHAHVVLTNPDMLHIGILPNHTGWAEFFGRLRFVVLDEIHMYRGVFGSHTANVLRRLRRVAGHYGAHPQFVCCSATIANPAELAEGLVGEPFEVIDDDGSPSGSKLFLVWNPPLLEREPDPSGQAAPRRRSAYGEASQLITGMVRQRIRSIAFVRARKIAELLLRRCRGSLKGAPKLAEALMPYRGGYLPEERREIERRLFDGSLLSVCSTTALEVGVDIGGLDATVMVGYPGSIAATWQQAGRSGRSGRDSLAVLVTLPSALDQFIAQNPEYLFGSPTERAVVDPANRFILAGHLLCAAHELPLMQEEEALFGPGARELLEALQAHRYVTLRDRWFYTGFGEPAPEISIRSAAGPGYEIVDDRRGQVLGTVDAQTAFYHVHPGAVYLHLGDTYQVRRLDLDKRRAHVEPMKGEYYTEPQWTNDVLVGEELAQRSFEGATVHFGELVVSTKMVSYCRISESTGALLGTEVLDLPERRYETCGMWVTVGEELAREHGADETALLGGLHAIEHSLIAMAPLFAMCEPLDLAGASQLGSGAEGQAAVFVHDAYPGGVGMAEALYDRAEELLEAARANIAGCPCATGCPGCVQSPFCGSNNQPMDKAVARAMLEAMLRSGGQEPA